MNLILCAGDRQKEGWTHHDIRSVEGIDIQCDLLDIKEHVKENSCEKIEITHALEHFPTKQVPEVLKLIHSILKEGGQLYIEVPNFKWHAQLVMEYRDEDAVYYAFGGQLDEFDFHKTGFTPDILRFRLRDAGFKEINVSGNDTLTATCIK